MDPGYRLTDLGDRRTLTVDAREHSTGYSARVLRLLTERTGPRRAALYLPFRETRVAACGAGLGAAGRSPSLCLPYLDRLVRRR